ncbi:hypothetical protein [Streptomyces sp. NPDC088246]|uniref:hypothetical protein n=1 Tax=Streptomyces sp. NPDC088246 TaxID=3365842 RepID=UPI0037F42F88
MKTRARSVMACSAGAIHAVCGYCLWRQCRRTGSLDDRLPPAAGAAIGPLSEFFRGALRPGWIRASTTVIRRLADIKRSVGLSCPVVEQLPAVELFHRLPGRARRLRGEKPRRARTAHRHCYGR